METRGVLSTSNLLPLWFSTHRFPSPQPHQSLWSLSFQLSEAAMDCLRPSCLCCILEPSSRKKGWDLRIYFIGLPFLRDHSPGLPVVWCLKTAASCIWLCFLVVYGRMVSPVPVLQQTVGRSQRWLLSQTYVNCSCIRQSWHTSDY